MKTHHEDITVRVTHRSTAAFDKREFQEQLIGAISRTLISEAHKGFSPIRAVVIRMPAIGRISTTAHHRLP